MSVESPAQAPSRLAVRRACPGAPGAIVLDKTRLGGPALVLAFSLAAVGAGAARALTTTYLPVLLERIQDAPTLIGAVLSVNAIAGLVVPLAVGMWSDHHETNGLGRRLPLMVAGTALAAGGLLAIALGNASSYLALALAAALVYTGLNALTTLHRALVVDDVGDDRRPAVTSAQEIAATVGAGIAVGLGAALIEPAPGLAFVLGALVLVAAAVPTLVVVNRLHLGAHATPAPRTGWRESIGDALRLPGAREVLLAQALWVFAYAALPAFFVLYARDELGVGVGVAGALPLAFGLAIVVAMLLAGRARRRASPAAAARGRGAARGRAPAGRPDRRRRACSGRAYGRRRRRRRRDCARVPLLRALHPGRRGRHFQRRLLRRPRDRRRRGAPDRRPRGGAERHLSQRAVARRRRAARVSPARRRGAPAPGRRRTRPRPARVAAVMPVFASGRAADVGWATLDHVDELVIVDDGAPREIARLLAPLAADERVRVVTLEDNGGKGTAVATGVELLLWDDGSAGRNRRARLGRPARSRPDPRPGRGARRVPMW